MNKQYDLAIIFISIALILTGCASGISQQARSQITYFGPFNSVQIQPDKYMNQIVMWGGRIIETLNRNDSTEMVILQMELDSQGYPQKSDQSQGRFLVRSNQFKDPAIYSEGTLITVVGRLEDSETRLIGEMPYLYPVITVMEMKRWTPGEEMWSRVHFGFGIGAHF